MSRRLSLCVLALTFVLPAAAADQPRTVPDSPASFALTGDQYWIVVSERVDGEAAIGLAREQIGETPKVQVARTKDGKYAVLVGPVPKMSDADLKSKYAEGRGPAVANVRQSQGQEFVARAWQFADGRLASGELQDGKPFTLEAGGVGLTMRVEAGKRKKKKDDAEYFAVSEGREDGKSVFRTRSEALYVPEPSAKASFVKLEGATPQAFVSYYSGGAHCCLHSSIVTKDAAGKWKVVPTAKLDGDYGPAFEDLDGDGTSEMLSGDNIFLYQFASYADSRMPAKIEKLIGGNVVDVTRKPEYRRYHVQYLAAMEAGADDEAWKQAGFLAAWVAQKALLGERAEAIARARKSYEKGDEHEFEECMVNKPLDKCPEIDKKLVPLAQALTKFLDRNGYR